MFRQIDPQFWVAPQIDGDAVRAAAAQGIGFIVNNRPDGEEPDAPQSAAIAEAAAAAGLGFAYIPVGHGGFSRPQIDALADVIRNAQAPVLAYCRSGTRSTNLWALTSAVLGKDADSIITQAANGGYDISHLRAMVQSLAVAGGGD